MPVFHAHAEPPGSEQSTHLPAHTQKWQGMWQCKRFAFSSKGMEVFMWRVEVLSLLQPVCVESSEVSSASHSLPEETERGFLSLRHEMSFSSPL